MKYHKIKDISRMTSLSIRSLQYYDDIGLLKPAKRSEAGYRLYSDNDLIQLQQIVTLKFLGFTLSTIKQILDNPEFEVMTSMQLQAQGLKEKALKINEASSLLTYIASQLEAGHPVNWNSTIHIINILEANKMTESLVEKYQTSPRNTELGQVSSYDPHYNPNRLYAIPRAAKRQEIGVDPKDLPFHGFDCWNHYEVSWLNEKGKPMVAIYDCSTPYLIESKSLKLYFNSLNNTTFKSQDEVQHTIEKDLANCLGGAVSISLFPLNQKQLCVTQPGFTGECIDDLDITCSVYVVEPSFLAVEEEMVEETLYSDLLKSNCLVTNQPDWGSVQIMYKGRKIQREGLLKYLVSFRNHNEFHEQCIERIFVDIMRYCRPESLTVYGRYTRRGGLDINPYRSTSMIDHQGLNQRLVRQ